MNQREVTQVNVNDYIRERKRNGAKYVYWGKSKAQYFYRFVCATWPIEYGYKLPEFDDLHGMTFMGIKHYLR